MLAQVFEAWPGPGPIAIHAESRSIPVALWRWPSATGSACTSATCPHPDDLLVIEAARQRGVPVTCEVTPAPPLSLATRRCRGWAPTRG